MHNPAGEGNAFFVCDFCRRHWEEDRPMVEGHRGALICARCLTPAYVELVHHSGGEAARGRHCTMCLEDRDQGEWESPMFPEARICLRCVKQAAGVLARDPDSGWKKPDPPADVPVTPDDDDLDDDNV